MDFGIFCVFKDIVTKPKLPNRGQDQLQATKAKTYGLELDKLL